MSKNMLSVALAAALAMSVSYPAVPAMAAAAQEIAYANPEGVVQNSNAVKTANQQRPVTYKAQYDRTEARRKELAAQLQAMQAKFEKDRADPKANQAALQQQYQAMQQIQESGTAELQQIMQPVAYSQAYVQEQVADKLPAAVTAAMTKRGVKLLLSQESVILESPTYNLSPTILAELNALVPTAQLVPPAGWEPRQVREARAQQAAQGGKEAPASTAKQPAGR
ncbi:MAG: OmpH family outer membrane protein [Alphaproteobacteria bacterium]|nr:OmpH family outer membrane protein [Alphaproteobacteria bacterium]